MLELRSGRSGLRSCLRAKASSDSVSLAPCDAPRCAVCSRRKLLSSEIRASSIAKEPETAVSKFVEVMCNTAGQLTQCLHLLSLQQRRLRLLTSLDFGPEP